MRRRPLAGALLVLLVLGMAHWIYWYRPRLRPGTPRAETVPGRIFTGSELPYRLWVPYPHQNMARLGSALGELEPLLRSVAQVSGRAMPEMPSFGASRLPPASELVMAVDRSGEQFIAAARVYPLAGVLARLAGRLAGNPLLTGGRTELDGRTVDVSWHDGVWMVATPGVELPSAGGEVTDAKGLSWLSLGRSRGRLPAGEYRLWRDGDDLRLEGGDEATLVRMAGLAGRLAPMPLLMVENSRHKGRLASRALGLVPGIESIGGLPGAATAASGPKRWKLPGERILDIVGDGAPRLDVAGWRVVALEDESLAHGPALVEFAQWAEAGGPVDIGLWIELRATERLVLQVAEALEAVPIVGRREARRWWAAEGVLAPLAAHQTVTVFVTREPAAVAVRLWSSTPPEN